jgi:hypothetical protein
MKNPYVEILKQEYGPEYANKMMRWARKMVRYSDTATTPRDIQRDWDHTLALSTAEELRPYALAVTAVKFAEYRGSGKVAVNLSDILGTLFSKRMFNALRDEYVVDVFAVAPPYQFVFLLK